MQSDLIKVVHTVVLENDMPAKALADEIGKPYSTLLREINPYDRGAKLGAETLLEIMQQTRDVSPLKYMADVLGYEMVPKQYGSGETGQKRYA